MRMIVEPAGRETVQRIGAPRLARHQIAGRIDLGTIRVDMRRIGQHVVRLRKFPAWVPPPIKRAAKRLTLDVARNTLEGYSLG